MDELGSIAQANTPAFPREGGWVLVRRPTRASCRLPVSFEGKNLRRCSMVGQTSQNQREGSDPLRDRSELTRCKTRCVGGHFWCIFVSGQGVQQAICRTSRNDNGSRSGATEIFANEVRSRSPRVSESLWQAMQCFLKIACTCGSMSEEMTALAIRAQDDTSM